MKNKVRRKVFFTPFKKERKEKEDFYLLWSVLNNEKKR